MLFRLVHWIEHRLGWNGGDVTSWWDDGRLMVGFRCRGCGDVSGVHEAPRHISHPEEFL